eukprot:5748713-Pleurochrysis_carterae.AAC.1
MRHRVGGITASRAESSGRISAASASASASASSTASVHNSIFDRRSSFNARSNFPYLEQYGRHIPGCQSEDNCLNCSPFDATCVSRLRKERKEHYADTDYA